MCNFHRCVLYVQDVIIYICLHQNIRCIVIGLYSLGHVSPDMEQSGTCHAPDMVLLLDYAQSGTWSPRVIIHRIWFKGGRKLARLQLTLWLFSIKLFDSCGKQHYILAFVAVCVAFYTGNTIGHYITTLNCRWIDVWQLRLFFLWLLVFQNIAVIQWFDLFYAGLPSNEQLISYQIIFQTYQTLMIPSPEHACHSAKHTTQCNKSPLNCKVIFWVFNFLLSTLEHKSLPVVLLLSRANIIIFLLKNIISVIC